MQQKSLTYATYWRNSLADSELGQGAFKSKDKDGYVLCAHAEFETGQLPATTVSELFDGEPSDTEIITAILRPYVFKRQYQHGKANITVLPEFVTPVVIQASIDRKGRIFPLERVFVPRDILEPLDRGSLSVGSVDDFDAWLTTHTLHILDRGTENSDTPSTWFDNYWSGFLVFVQSLISDVTGNWPAPTDPYSLLDKWWLRKTGSNGGSSTHILPLYDHLIKSNPAAPLFDRYASEIAPPRESCQAPNSGFAIRLGHSSDTYPLADAQRDAMTHHLTSGQGDILGVNGPPGTGKTTLLLSIVATHWVQAAIVGGSPKLIAAASTNNQAVTNVIDAFAKDFSQGTGPFAGRWLPAIKSYGSYFPASDKEKQASEKYQTKSFFDSIENSEYFQKAKESFLTAAAKAYPDLAAPTVNQVVNQLQKDINDYANVLSDIDASWKCMGAAQLAAEAVLGSDPQKSYASLQQLVGHTGTNLATAQKQLENWEDTLSGEPFWMTLLSWIPAVEKRRFMTAKKTYRNATNVSVPASCTSIPDFTALLTHKFDELQTTYTNQKEQLSRAATLISAFDNAIVQWATHIEPVLGKVSDARSVTLADCDRTADTKIRFAAFLKASHYWEGRWLLEVEPLLPTIIGERGKTGATKVKPRWLRRMMITPCFVSTFYMLPSEMKVARHDVTTGFIPDYLYEFIDLLIVDEAGQVLPEVAGASFSLAKTALVIGDTLQIEPIWNTKPNVDIGNLLSNGLLDAKSIQADYRRICELGKTSASGSVMVIAQNASRYHYDVDMPRGMFLYEHRRCFDEIINYCNDLCYQNKLVPMRGSSPKEGLLPSMGYLHINGKCTQTSGGSRQNLLEAETIAEWIIHNTPTLEAHYKKKIHEIVGVVTPFGGQVAAISEACSIKGIAVGKGSEEMTVGTVHSLQGAERLVVIFSPAYSKHSDGQFMDMRTSMLNVAVSRAKDSFLVFGDMDIFNPSDTGRPRGLLAKYIFANKNNALDFPAMARQDLIHTPTDIKHLVNAEAHDAFLLDILKKATNEVHITSPWLRKRMMDETGLLSAMSDAVSRGTKVTVYSDRNLNRDPQEPTANKPISYWDSASEVFNTSGIELVNVPRLHSKIVSSDSDVLCIGSFNWLSAARVGHYAKHDTSISYSGPAVTKEIQVLLESLTSRK